MTTYRQLQSESAPKALRGKRGSAWMRAHGRAKDWTQDAVRQAVRAGLVAVAPVDALGYDGNERNLPRYPGDTDETYRARLQRAWELWQQAGTRPGLLAVLDALGFANAAIHTARDPIPPGESSWPPDGDPSNWSRFWVFLDVSAGSNPFNWQRVPWGSRRWGDGWTWGSTATRAQISLVRSVIRLWKAAHELCAGIVVDLPGGVRIRWAGME